MSTDELKAATIAGVRWVSFARLTVEALTIGSSVVLARLIPPAEFGYAAVALGVAAVAVAISWSGFGTPLIQMKALERGHIEVTTFLSVLIGIGLTLGTVLVLAPYVAEPIFGARVAYLLKLQAPVFLLSAISTVPNALLQRELGFRRLSEIEIVSMAVGPAVAIGLAAGAGLDGEALVLGGVASALVGTVLTLVVSAPTLPRWRRREAADVTSFGVFAALSSTAGTLYDSIDYVILGARLSPREVGLYWRGYQLGVEYQRKVSSIMLRLAFPIYSRATGLEQMRRLRSRMVRVNTVVLFPVLTTLIALAPELVPFLFGDEWRASVFPTQVLAIAGMGAVAAVGSASLLLAAGKVRSLFYYTLALLVGYIPVVTLASGYGLRTVVVAVAIYQILFVFVRFVFLESRQLGIPLRETWSPIMPALIASFCSLAVSYPVARWLEELEVGALFVVAGAGAVAVSVYGLALRLIFPATWRETDELVRALLGRERRGPGRPIEGAPAESES